MSDLLKKAKASKLQKPKNEPLSPVSKNSLGVVKSFYLPAEVWRDFGEVLEKVNSVGRRRISASSLMAALIVWSSEREVGELVEIIRKNGV